MKKEQTKSGGAICGGGVINESTFHSDPWTYMMNWVMSDENYEKYQKIGDETGRKLFFKKHAYSNI